MLITYKRRTLGNSQIISSLTTHVEVSNENSGLDMLFKAVPIIELCVNISEPLTFNNVENKNTVAKNNADPIIIIKK